MSSDDSQVTLGSIQKLLQDLFGKTEQQLATAALSEKLGGFEKRSTAQVAALSETVSELSNAHNAYAAQVDALVEGTYVSTALRRNSTPGHIRTPTQHRAVAVPNPEISFLQNEMRAMQSKVHYATSSAPNIDRVIEESKRTPFSRRISTMRIKDTRKVKFLSYEGKGDPKVHLHTFLLTVGRVDFDPYEEDAGYCKLFAETFVGPALLWFASLQEGTIDSFTQLSTTFVKQYSSFIGVGVTDAQLWNLSQGPNDSLRSYITKFKEIMVQIPRLPDSAALSALKNGLWHESRLREELTVNRPSSIQDALHWASNWIIAEEEKAALAKKYKVTPKPSFDQGARQYVQGQRPGPASFAVDHQKGGPKGAPSKQRFGSRGRNGALPSNKWTREKQENNSFCELHKVAGHATPNCKKLMLLRAERFMNGVMPDITIDELNQAQNAVQLVSEAVAEEEELPPAKKPKALIEEIPQETKKRIDVIMGGSRIF
ncbi:uncharacterized protein LOC111830952 [Capsella rubella]|uniref:uncharacterized protein LOC111830952 n=1 Tax=Capsella rubella TaxID=81985 RepID=UPI000CD59B4D|nr:uncharacterized protein LOC111830952 [Capsella rubella]